MHNSASPLAAIDFHSSANTEANVVATEKRRACLRVNAEIEVEVGTVLVRAGQTVLGAELVALGWAEIGNLDHNAVASIGNLVVRAVSLDGELPASATSGTSALAL